MHSLRSVHTPATNYKKHRANASQHLSLIPHRVLRHTYSLTQDLGGKAEGKPFVLADHQVL